MLPIKYALIGLMIFTLTGCGKSERTAEEHTHPVVGEPVTHPPEPLQVPEREQTKIDPEPARPVEQARETTRTERREQAAPAQRTPPTSAPETRAEAQPQTPPVEVPSVQTPEPLTIAEPATVPEPQYASIPSGTLIQVRLQDPLDTATNVTGETFQVILDRAIVVNGMTVARRGSILEGELTRVERSGRVQGRAAMSMQLTSLRVNGQTYPIQTEILSFVADSTKAKDAGKVGIGAGLGAAIGAIAGGGRGAAIGAAVGAGAGGATVVATRGDELTFPAEKTFDFELQRSVSVMLE
jgi:hypothetical protein